jgi:pyruvate/2-oxoglutarate/acetoin dehydrogenase E1 component
MTFAQAINAGLAQAVELDDSVFVYGIGADGRSGIFGSTLGLVERFGLRIPTISAGHSGLMSASCSD